MQRLSSSTTRCCTIFCIVWLLDPVLGVEVGVDLLLQGCCFILFDVIVPHKRAVC